jgi:hypothetical protein
MMNPEARARVVAAALRNLPKAHTPEAKARQRAAMPAAVVKITETRLRWCPPDKRDEYRLLVRRKRMTAAQARQIIMDSLTPFERQMNALRMGAKIVANDARPSGNQVVRRFG